MVTLKIWSRSQKSNQTFKPSQHYNDPSFGSRERVQTSFFWSKFENFKVLVWPWKCGQKGHQNLITSFPLPIMCLCKFGQNLPIGSWDRVQTRSYADANKICTKSNMSTWYKAKSIDHEIEDTDPHIFYKVDLWVTLIHYPKYNIFPSNNQDMKQNR